MRVAIIGQGYVGLTATVGAYKGGHSVTGIDISEKIVSSLNNGVSHIEGIPGVLLVEALESGRYFASSNYEDISGAEIIIIAVPTPLNNAGEPDLSLLKSASESIARYAGSEALIINESTSFIGTLRRYIASTIQKINPKIANFAVSPERVDPGNELFGISNTPRLVGGTSEQATSKAIAFYSTFCENVIQVSAPEVAEAAKLLENSFRFVNIGFINEFSRILSSIGVSTSEVIKAASTKPYGFMPFYPNVGIGGHCIPVDPHYLQKNAREIGFPSKYVELSETYNREMPVYSVSRLQELYGSLKEKRILVIGVSYKPNISDTRESPAEHVILELKKRGAIVSWHDPLVANYLGETSSPVSGTYDLALVLVQHDELNMDNWLGGPIYCVNPNSVNADWRAILDSDNFSQA
jgi:UDP-N-acetyl-D-glucosamine dehydrogenase